MYQESDEALETVGYVLQDLNGDGVPELLIGMMDGGDKDLTGTVYSGYSLKDDEPVCFLEGWARNTYRWLGGGRFYNFGSSGAMYSMFGVFTLSEDGTELDCEDLYFTGEGKNETLDFFHNTTGVWDEAEAELLDMSDEEFWALREKTESGAQHLDLTPFSEYEPTAEN